MIFFDDNAEMVSPILISNNDLFQGFVKYVCIPDIFIIIRLSRLEIFDDIHPNDYATVMTTIQQIKYNLITVLQIEVIL